MTSLDDDDDNGGGGGGGVDDIDAPERQEHARRKRARTSAPTQALSHVHFSPAEWRSFQRNAHVLASSARVQLSDNAASSPGLAAELAAAIARASHDKHGVFDTAVIQKVLYSCGDFVMLKHELSPSESLPRDRLVVGLIQYFIDHEATSTLYCCLTAMFPRPQPPELTDPLEKPLRVGHVAQYVNDIARFDFGATEFVRVDRIAEHCSFRKKKPEPAGARG